MEGPDFFIVGAPKCGTTSLARYLSEHPEVYVPPGEPHYFGKDIAYNPVRITKVQYEELFATPGQDVIKGDQSTWYLFSRTAAEEIHRYDPNARIIVNLRNPIELVYSLHWHLHHKTGREDIADFESALSAEGERREGRRIPKRARFVEQLFYSEVPKFTKQIERYVTRFGWERVHVVVFDDLMENPSDAYREVLRFLGVDDDFQARFTVHNPTVVRRSRAVDALLFGPTVSSIARRTFQGRIARSLRTVRAGIRSRNLRPVARPPMPGHIRRRLTSLFQEEIGSLGRFLGRDFTHWTQ